MDETCANCKGTLTGRASKRFCSSRCRSAAYNRARLEDQGEKLLREINHTLRHNRQVLQKACPGGKATLGRQALLEQGFDFGHFTHLYRTQTGNTYRFCYDYGYLLLDGKKILIVNWRHNTEG